MIQGGQPNRAHKYEDKRFEFKSPHVNEKVAAQGRAIRDFRKAKKKVGPTPEKTKEEELSASAAEEATETVSASGTAAKKKKSAGEKKPKGEGGEGGLKPGTPAPGQVRRVKVVNRDAYGNETDAYVPRPPPPAHKAAPAPTGKAGQDLLNQVGTAAENKVSDWTHALKNPTTKRNEGGKEPGSLFEHLMHGAFGGHGGNIIYHGDAPANAKGERRIASQNTGNGTSRHWIEYSADSGVVPPTHEETGQAALDKRPEVRMHELGYEQKSLEGPDEVKELRQVVPPSRALTSGPSDQKGSFERTAKAFQQAERAKQVYQSAVRAHYTGPRGPSFIERHINGGLTPGPKHKLRVAYDTMRAATLTAHAAHLAHAARHGDLDANAAEIEGRGRA